MTRHGCTTLMLAAAIALPSLVHAQAARNAKEFIQDEHQIAVDKRQLARDQKEIRDFHALLQRLDGLTPQDMAGYGELNAKLRFAMQREFDQGKQKMARANREVGQSRREARGERHEAHATGAARDYAQAADDRHDLRDDRRDRHHAVQRSARMGSIINETKALQPSIPVGDADAMLKNRRLMGEFLDLLRADLRATATELVEDRAERREDRRERRTDRRE